MELDYKDLQAIADVEKQLKQTRWRLSDGNYRIFMLVPFASLPWLLMNHGLPRGYISMLIICLVLLVFIYSLKDMIYRKRNAKQLTLLLNVARRAMDSDPANRQKLNELQTLKFGN